MRRRFEPLRTPRGEFGYPVSADTELISALGELRCGQAGPSLCLTRAADPGFAVFVGGKKPLTSDYSPEIVGKECFSHCSEGAVPSLKGKYDFKVNTGIWLCTLQYSKEEVEGWFHCWQK